MSTFDFEKLNAAQKEAVQTTEGPVLVIAGPGTGKTFTLVKRIAYLVFEKGVNPCEIMVVTFTEKAATELITRISNEFVRLQYNTNINEIYIGTFHSVCLRLLKEYSISTDIKSNIRMLDAFDQTYLVCRNIENFSSLRGFKKHFSATLGPWKQSMEVCRYVNQMMEEMVDIEVMESDQDEDARFLARLVKKYLELLKRNNAMDFSSIQTQTYSLFESNADLLRDLQHKIRYIMVDEYQDTNYIQEQLVFLIAGSQKNICVVGDDDQGMYRFRGATIRNILEFPQKFEEKACKIIHLNVNYRSDSDIISFYNKWMQDVDGINLFNWDKYRYEKQIVAADSTKSRGKTVFKCGGDSLYVEKKELLDFIRRLRERGNISDYNQVAFLFRSVKSDEATSIGEFLEENGIPVHSPRSEIFFERQEVKQILGCLISCFPPYMQDLKNNTFRHTISESLRKYYIGCVKEAAVLLRSDKEFYVNIDNQRKRIQMLAADSKENLLDIFYRLVSFEPFKGYLSADLKGNIQETRAVRNLSEISRMLSKFCYLHGMHVITQNNKIILPEELFNIYLKYLYIDGVGEYEDASEYAPSGCVSFMTIHQSKGLEFPVVVVGSLGTVPRRNNDPLLLTAETRFFNRMPFEPLADIKYFDFWRLYYVAFSRAQNMLVLAAKNSDSKYFGHHLEALPHIGNYEGRDTYAIVKNVNFKHVYSFTSHISVYEGCPRQYKFYKEYGFARKQMLHTSVGSLVHATLEDMNKCIIKGMLSKVTEATIKEWFLLNYGEMQTQTGYSLTDEQQADALAQVLRYYHNRKTELGNVWKAEEEINLVLPEYILQGIIDLIAGAGDTVEIVDYKTGPKPDVINHPERVEHYRKQLEIYAYLIEKRYKKKVSRMHLYYTSTLEGSPVVSFDCNRKAIDATVAEITDIIHRIENKDFECAVQKNYACRYCDMKYVCGNAAM